MRRPLVGLIGLALAAPALLAGGSPAAASSPPPDRSATASPHSLVDEPDDHPGPQETKRRALREEALRRVLAGTATPVTRDGSTVLDLGTAATARTADTARARLSSTSSRPPHDYVELARQKTDKIFVLLTEFGNERHPEFPDLDSNPDVPGPTVFDGPLHNQIPEPGPNDDYRVWQPDSSPSFYRQLYFADSADDESVKTYLERQSSGRYSVEGTVTDWVKVRFNAARYGRGSNRLTWELVRDGMTQWVADQRASGRTAGQIRSELASFDEWDRYDFDHDGDFNEPDGYIDHFQVLHAGGDQADGDPYQGEDAIWSHRGFVFPSLAGTGGPPGGFGGTEIAGTGLWVGDYTVQPENGGLSTTIHEYGHDLGLVDHYDTATRAGNGVQWWTVMAELRGWAPGDRGVGTRAAELSAWDKLMLGWLDHTVVEAGQTRRIELGPHEYNTAKPQGVVVTLPDKRIEVDLVPPRTGALSWWSESGEDLQHTLTRRVSLPAGAPATLSFAANWDIEDCGPDACDYAYVEVDEGTGFKAVAGNITNPAENHGIDGTSGGWVDATFDLSAFAGRSVDLRLRYQTDPAVKGLGFFADDITLTSGSTIVFTDGAESAGTEWEHVGFKAVGAKVTKSFPHYYIASYRTYQSYGTYLRTSPYNFGFADTSPQKLEHFPYADGLLVSYWDTSFTDNNKSKHPGQGLILPIDAHPEPLLRRSGSPWDEGVQVYDAPFSTQPTDALQLHRRSVLDPIPSLPAEPVFDDVRTYWYPQAPGAGVKVPHAGVRITVLDQKPTTMTIEVSPSRG